MLKLERKSRSEGISVIFYQYPSLFNKSFLNAFLIALLIHLAGLTLFRIDLVSIRHSEIIHAPVLLQIDFNVPLQETVAEVEREDLLKMSLEPRFSVLNYPAAPSPRFTSNLLPSPSHLLLTLPAIPSSIQANLFIEKEKSKNFSITLSGPLAEEATWELDEDGLLLFQYLSKTTNPKDKHQTYSIEVENNRIYWYENKNSPELNSYLASLLPYIKFHLPQGFYHLMGDLELSLP